MHRPVLSLMELLWKIRMTFSSPPGEGLGAVKSTLWKDILKTRCLSTDVTDGKPLVTVPVTRALRELLRKGITSWRAKQSHERPEGWGLCIVYLYPRSGIVKNRYLQSRYKEVDVNNKRHARIRIWAFACEWRQPPDPHLISESYFSLFFCGTASSGWFVVGLVPTLFFLLLF